MLEAAVVRALERCHLPVSRAAVGYELPRGGMLVGDGKGSKRELWFATAEGLNGAFGDSRKLERALRKWLAGPRPAERAQWCIRWHDETGYVWELAKGPLKSRYRKVDVDGRTRQLSRVLMEQHLGRKLERHELVHHRNHNKLDDRIENYEVTTSKEHSVHHNQKHPITKPCAQCGKVFEPHPTKRLRQVTCSRECFKARGSIRSREKMDRGQPRAALTLAQAREIYQRVSKGDGLRALAREYGCPHHAVMAVARGSYVTKDGRFSAAEIEARNTRNSARASRLAGSPEISQQGRHPIAAITDTCRHHREREQRPYGPDTDGSKAGATPEHDGCRTQREALGC